MDWKKTITVCIDQADREQLLACGRVSLAKTLRYVQMHIWGDDHQIRRWYAIEALGWLCAELGADNEEAFRDLLRRSLWAMNDESGNVPWAAPEVMAAVIAAQPKRYAEFVPMLVTNGLDNEICRKGVAWAVTQLWQTQEEKLRPFLPKLQKLLHDPHSEVRGYAAVMIAKIGEPDWQITLGALQHDTGICYYYAQGSLAQCTIGELVQELLDERFQA